MSKIRNLMLCAALLIASSLYGADRIEAEKDHLNIRDRSKPAFAAKATAWSRNDHFGWRYAFLQFSGGFWRRR